jgi:N-methylhydantoinase A/oxoprolinase/acetone carboxylase beta subunit
VLIADPDHRRAELNAVLARLERAARSRLTIEGGAARSDRVIVEHRLECRYVGQTFTLDVAPARSIRRVFEAAHRAAFGHAYDDRAIEVVDVVVRARAPRRIELPQPPRSAAKRRGPPRPQEISRAVFDSRGAVEMPCFERAALRPGDQIAGPARIDDDGATIVVEPSNTARIDAGANVRLRIEGGGDRRQKRL